MELRRIAEVLIRYWWLILIPTVIAAGLSLPALLNRTTATSGGYTTSLRYNAMQSMTAIPRAEGDYQDIWIASQYTVDAFTDWVRGSQFASEVAAQASQQLGAVVEPGTLLIAADNEDSLGQLTLGHDSAEVLAALQEAAITVLSERSGAYFAQLGGVPAAVTIIDRSAIAAAPPPLTDRFAPVLRIALGLLVGIGLAFLAHYFDPMLRRRDEIESLGLRVMGSIPRR